ncbi:MAG: tetratricopeptide repeat protein [Anaerolineae bacterium]|nr:tetratricopeptide repeat protein [Anaerolineae bacterium]
MAWYRIKIRITFALSTVLLVIMVVACSRAPSEPPVYGAKIRYAEGQPLTFPDVTLEFVGERETPPSSDYPRAMRFYDFKVSQGNQAQLVSWSAGTGDIGPALFELAGNRYLLELAMSDQLGSLAEDELVLWQQAIPATETPAATPAGIPLEAQDYYHKGLTQAAAGLNEEAVTNFTQAITLYPTYSEAYQFRAQVYVQLGQYDLARADYQQVLALNPQPEMQATVTAALQEIAQAKTIAPTPTVALPTPTSLPPVKISLGQPFSVALRQYGRLASTELGVEFYELVEDTRCPRQAVCESEGWARIAIYVWRTNIEPTEFILNTDPSDANNSIPYDSYRIRLVNLDPYPETSETKIAPQDYRATFVVSE